MRLLHLAAAIALLTSLGCHPGPIVDTGSKPAGVGGTIAGIVSSQGNTPIADRKVTAIETTTGTRYDATTGSNGGYTIKVPGELPPRGRIAGGRKGRQAAERNADQQGGSRSPP